MQRSRGTPLWRGTIGYSRAPHCAPWYYSGTRAAPRPSQVGAGRWAVGHIRHYVAAHSTTGQRIHRYSRDDSRGTHRGTFSSCTHTVLTGSVSDGRMAKYGWFGAGRAAQGGPSRHGVPSGAWDLSHDAVLYRTRWVLTAAAAAPPPSTECKVEHTCACSGRITAAVWHRTTARAPYGCARVQRRHLFRPTPGTPTRRRTRRRYRRRFPAVRATRARCR